MRAAESGQEVQKLSPEETDGGFRVLVQEQQVSAPLQTGLHHEPLC